MPKDREKKTLNPATAHLKSEKARALKKGKAAVSAQRTDRLASRNPFRLERQIADLKALAADGGLGARDKKQLEELERQLGMVRKAREKVGDNRVSHSAGREEGSSRGRDEVMEEERAAAAMAPRRTRACERSLCLGIPHPRSLMRILNAMTEEEEVHIFLVVLLQQATRIQFP
ncbi:MAG: hypothetical protein L6R37_002802 [Teloschistes peruensis]|nr:MAG: hypothetical protein L6R37_002802 [Teloschistes peruensis]